MEQLRETDKVFTLGKWVSQYLKSVVGICEAAVCGNGGCVGVGTGYTGLWRACGVVDGGSEG